MKSTKITRVFGIELIYVQTMLKYHVCTQNKLTWLLYKCLFREKFEPHSIEVYQQRD